MGDFEEVNISWELSHMVSYFFILALWLLF